MTTTNLPPEGPTPEDKQDIGSRLGHSHAATAETMRVNSRLEAYGSVFVKLGIIFSGISLFKLIADFADIPVPSLARMAVAGYTAIFHTPIEVATKPLGLSPPEAVKDAVSIYVLVGAVLSRPLQAVLRLADQSNSPATFYETACKRFGGKVDLFMYNTFPHMAGRYAVIATTILLMPLTLAVFWKYPFTKTAGGVLGVYQARDDKITDAFTLDMPHYDARLILRLQLTGSLAVCGLLLIISFLFSG